MGRHIKRRVVTTKKEHECFGCYKPIPIGTRQLVDTCENDGEVYDVRLCPVCNLLASEYDKSNNEWHRGDLGEEPYWSEAKLRLEPHINLSLQKKK